MMLGQTEDRLAGEEEMAHRIRIVLVGCIDGGAAVWNIVSRR